MVGIFISIFSFLLISHCDIVNGAYNISEQDFIKSPAQEVITAFALADSFERNRSENSLSFGEAPDSDEGPSLSSVKLASKWIVVPFREIKSQSYLSPKEKISKIINNPKINKIY
jgi:hypothetical protein